MVNESLIGGNSSKQLQSFKERILKLEEEKDALSDDIKALYEEMKREGIDVPTMRGIIRDAKKDPDKVHRARSLRAEYEQALGIFAGTELGEAAIRRVS